MENKLWHFQYNLYQESQTSLPSFTAMGGGGFLSRNFELNADKLAITNESFEQAYLELIDFLGREKVEYDVYIQLVGPVGDIDEVVLNKQVSIVTAGHELARAFSVNFGSVGIFNRIPMFEDDYVLKIHIVADKSCFGMHSNADANKLEKPILEKWADLPILGLAEKMKLGSRMRVSKDWAVVNTWPIGGADYSYVFLPEKEPALTITNDKVASILAAADILDKSADVKSLDKKVFYAIERLSKSKSAFTLDDRVVELAIALEYLINTSRQDITLQLTVKIINLLYDANEDETIFPMIKQFYALRSKVIHGDDKVGVNPKNLGIVDFTEEIVQKGILRMIELNSKYTKKQIESALDK